MDLIVKEDNVLKNVLNFGKNKSKRLIIKNGGQLFWMTILHIVGTLHHTCICVFVASLDLSGFSVQDIKTLDKYQAGFLTGWNFLFQTVFLSLALIYDILEWSNKHEGRIAHKIRYARDVLFSGLALPMSLFISSMFWTIYLIDRELVFPVIYDQIVPWWFNHCVHTNIVVVVVIETLLQPRRHPADQKVEVMLNGAVGVAYAVVYYSIYYFSHRWLYAIFGIMTWWQICLYQIMIWTSCFVFYFVQFPINRMFHKADENENTAVPIEEVKEDKDTVPEVDRLGPDKSDKVDFKIPPFSTKSWSLKYRSIRSQFENSRL